MEIRSLKCAAVAFAIVAAGAARAAPVTKDDFLATTTGNLVNLCSAQQTDPLYTAAINFCHGYAVGTYRMLVIEEAASRSKRKAFCIPDNPPTRDEAIAAFVAWAQSKPDALASKPSDGIMAYVMSQYPCNKK
jgi:hypothetical protein